MDVISNCAVIRYHFSILSIVLAMPDVFMPTDRATSADENPGSSQLLKAMPSVMKSVPLIKRDFFEKKPYQCIYHAEP